LQAKEEPVYVIPGSDAEAYVTRRFPHKRPRRVGGGRRPRSIRSFLSVLPHVFQRHASEGLDATFHFRFTGEEHVKATIVMRDKAIRVERGRVGTPDLFITADSRTWLGFLAKERSLIWALLRGKVRLKGSPRLLMAFGKCFPS
jgi:SCP-2 sterol transfer family